MSERGNADIACALPKMLWGNGAVSCRSSELNMMFFFWSV